MGGRVRNLFQPKIVHAETRSGDGSLSVVKITALEVLKNFQRVEGDIQMRHDYYYVTASIDGTINWNKVFDAHQLVGRNDVKVVARKIA